MPQVRLERVSLIDSLVGQLEAQIVSREYPVGMRLPGEEELATQFGVSRPVVRESLSRLRERGYLETINGRGTFVRHPDADDLSASLLRQIQIASHEGYTVDNLYEARLAMEVTTVRLAAERASSEDITKLREHLAAMVRNRDNPEAFTAADVSFHLDLATAARNPFLSALIQPLVRIIIEGVLGSSLVPESVEDGIRVHTELLAHVENRDPQGAAAAMRRHLSDSRRAFPDEVLSRLRDWPAPEQGTTSKPRL